MPQAARFTTEQVSQELESKGEPALYLVTSPQKVHIASAVFYLLGVTQSSPNLRGRDSNPTLCFVLFCLASTAKYVGS